MNTLWITAVCIGIAIAILIGIYLLRKSKLSELSNFGQGIGGLATTLALVAAAVVYFQEARDRPHLTTEITTRSIPVLLDGKPTALIQITAEIRNHGSRPALVACTNLDVAGIPKKFSSPVQYSEYEYNFPSLITDNNHNKYWIQCWDKKISSRKETYIPKSGYMWANTDVAPGGYDSLYYEIMVPCTYAGIRILVKVRKLDSTMSYEYRMISSINDVCTGKKSVSIDTTKSQGDD